MLCVLQPISPPLASREYWSVLLLSIDFPGSGREENTGLSFSLIQCAGRVWGDVSARKLQQNCRDWTDDITDSQPDIGAQTYQVDQSSLSEVFIWCKSRRDRTDSILLGCLVGLLILFWILYLNREFIRAKLRWVFQFNSSYIHCEFPSVQLLEAVVGRPLSLRRRGWWRAGAGLWRNGVGREESVQQEDNGKPLTSTTLRTSSLLHCGRQQRTGILIFSCDSLETEHFLFCYFFMFLIKKLIGYWKY